MAFIRQGGWCACGRSFNASSAEFEAGISAYDCSAAGNKLWQAHGDAWKKNGSAAVKLATTWFLVEGDEEGRGGDKEPLLSNVVVQSVLALIDPKTAMFEETDDAPVTGKNHAGFGDGGCHGESFRDIFEASNAEAEDDDELYRNLAGEDVPFDDLTPAEQRYYSDPTVDETTTSLAEYCEQRPGEQPDDDAG